MGHVVAGLAEVPYASEVEVVLHAPIGEVRRRLPRTVGTLCEHPDGALFRGRADRLDGMAQLLAGLGWRFTVRRPDELRAAVRELAARLTEDAARARG